MTLKDNIAFIGLDFETSTGNTKNLAPIQIGITYEGEDFEANIGGWSFDDSGPVRWSEESAKIHGLTQEELQVADNIFAVDIYASAWLLPLIQGIQRMDRVLVGWNVGSFDRRIVNDWMPNLDKILSYRTLDLNTVCYFTADLLDDSYNRLKNEVKTAATKELGEENWHNALFDAQAGLITYRLLLEKADLDIDGLIKEKL